MTRTDHSRATRYLKIMEWARARYTRNGHLKLTVGGQLAPWLRIESAAYNRYLARA